MHLGGHRGRVSVVTPPADAPITLDAIKAHLRVEHDDDDTLLSEMIASAVDWIDGASVAGSSVTGWLGRSLYPRTLRLTLDRPPCRVVRLPGPPVTAINTITVRDSDDDLTVIYDSDVGSPVDTIGLVSDFTAEPAAIRPDDAIGWPSDIKNDIDAVRIEYVAGYTDVPPAISQWLKLVVGKLYRDREASILGVSEVGYEFAVRLLDNLRVRY